jgi:hypothetical protein
MNKEDFENIKINAYLNTLEKHFNNEMCLVHSACDGANIDIRVCPDIVQKIKLRLDTAEAYYDEWKRVRNENNIR